MRFMLLVKSDRNSEAGAMPSARQLAEMGDYNEALARAGVLLAAEGLHPSARGARVKFAGAGRTLVEGPFANPHELIAGFWLIEVPSRAEAIEWVTRCPNPGEGEAEIEIRQVFEPEDFGPALTPELRGGRGAPARADDPAALGWAGAGEDRERLHRHGQHGRDDEPGPARARDRRGVSRGTEKGQGR